MSEIKTTRVDRANFFKTPLRPLLRGIPYLYGNRKQGRNSIEIKAIIFPKVIEIKKLYSYSVGIETTCSPVTDFATKQKEGFSFSQTSGNYVSPMIKKIVDFTQSLPEEIEKNINEKVTIGAVIFAGGVRSVYQRAEAKAWSRPHITVELKKTGKEKYYFKVSLGYLPPELRSNQNKIEELISYVHRLANYIFDLEKERWEAWGKGWQSLLTEEEAKASRVSSQEKIRTPEEDLDDLLLQQHQSQKPQEGG